MFKESVFQTDMEKCSNRDSSIKIPEKDMIHTRGNRGPGWIFTVGYFQS